MMLAMPCYLLGKDGLLNKFSVFPCIEFKQTVECQRLEKNNHGKYLPPTMSPHLINAAENLITIKKK